MGFKLSIVVFILYAILSVQLCCSFLHLFSTTAFLSTLYLEFTFASATSGSHLRYYRHFRPQFVQTDVTDVDVIDDDASGGGLDDAEKSQGQRGLSCAGSTNDADLGVKTTTRVK